MLQNIRNNIQGVIAKIIIGLIIIPFAVFGIDSLVGGGGPVNVAEINGDEVSEQELLEAIGMKRRQLMNMMGQNADPSLLDDNLLREPALEQLIQQKLLLQAADKASIAVSSTVLDQAIVSMPQFQEDGKFSPQLYQNILRSNGMSLSYFKKIMTDDMILNQLNSGLASSDFVTEKELIDTAKVIGQKRSFRYFILPQDKVADGISISDEEVQSYYKENLASFQTENRVKLEYIEIKQEDFFEPVDDAALKESYELEMADFSANEERRASHILFEVTEERDEEKTKALANSIAERLRSGEKISDLAKEFSDDTGSASAGGDLGYTQGETFPEKFEEVLFGLELNAISDAVLTDSGYHVIQLTDVKGTDKPTFEERRPVLTQKLQLEAAEGLFVTAVEELRDLVFNSEGLSGPASDLKLTVSTSDWVTETLGEGVLGSNRVLKAAFSAEVLEDRNNSEVIELAADHYIVVRVLEHDSPHAQELAEVEENIRGKLTKEKASGMVISRAQEAVAALQDGKVLEDIARGNDYQWQVELSVTRTSANIPKELVSAAFDMSVMPEGTMVIKTIPMNNGDAAVVQLEKVEDGSWDDFSAPQKRGITGELQRGYATKSMNGFVDTIRNNAEIIIL